MFVSEWGTASMNMKIRIIGLSFAMGLLFWIIESQIAYYKYGHGTFGDNLIFDLSPLDFIVRLWVVIGFIVLGIAVANYIDKRREAERKEAQAYLQLTHVFNSTDDGLCLINTDFVVERINKRLLELSGKDEHQVVGHKCYDVFKSEKCHFDECPMHKIVDGGERVENVIRKTLPDGTVRDLVVTATPCRSSDGALLGIVENLRDITRVKAAEQALRYRLNLEKILAEISTNFLRLGPEDVDHGIESALESIGRFSAVERAYIFLFRDNQTFMDNTHEWCAEGVSREKSNLQNIPTETLPWWMSRLERFDNIHLPQLSDMPSEAVDERAVLEAQGIKSVLAVPLVYSGGLIGFLGFDIVSETKIWTDEDIRVLKMAGEIIVSAIVRREHDLKIRELSEKRAELETIIGGSPAVAFLWKAEADWPVEFVTDNVRQFGYAPSDFYGGLPFADVIYEEDRERVNEEVRLFISRPDIQRYEQEYRIVASDGRLRWVDDRTWLRRNSLGEITHFQGVILDITERKHAEQELESERRQLLSIFDSITEAIYVSDPDTYEVLYVNRFLRDKLGHDPVGNICYREFQGLDAPCPFCTNHIIRAHPGVEHNWEHFNPALGRYYMALDRLITWPDGRDVRFELAVDITERKESERTLGRLVAELRNKNSELEDFAYVVSHDLKAPLRAIGTLAEWISTDSADRLDNDGREQLDLLMQRVRRMHDLIDGVLKYSRVGRLKEERVPVDLSLLIPEVIDMIAPPDGLTVRVESGLPVIVADRTRIQQVFENLLSNAVKFMNRPDGEIVISATRDNGFWRFAVRDNGPGIEEQYHEKIFRIFQTLNARDEFESTGVGLTLVRKIVTMYGGEVHVESTPGEGSTFVFTLPESERTA